MYYTYILQSLKDRKLYIDFTSNLKRRFLQHQSGGVLSTKGRRPLRLIFYEAFLNQIDAKRREEYFKTTQGKKALKLMVRYTLHSGVEQPGSSSGS